MSKWTRDRKHLPLQKDHWKLYKIIHLGYWKKFHDFPNLINCRDINDKIQWLKLFDQHQDIVRCCDKILLREYVRELVGERYLVNLYQVHDRFEQLNFNLLPKAFVIKTNNDSGTVILVRDKSTFDFTAAKVKIETALRRNPPFGWLSGEWAYAFINSKVFVEELLNPSDTIPPPDYKFYVTNGNVCFMRYIYGRGMSPIEQTIDKNGKDLEAGFNPKKLKYCKKFVEPENWNKMIEIASILGQKFKFVRVDLYNVNGRIAVGELTFWPAAGFQKGEGVKKLNHLMKFDRNTFRPVILSDINKISYKYHLIRKYCCRLPYQKSNSQVFKN